MKPGKRAWFWITVCCAAVCAALVTLLSLRHGGGVVLVARDALDPLAGLVEPYAEGGVVRLNPYQLGHALPDLGGMAFVFGNQARPYRDGGAYGYVPVYSATVVIAVNRNGKAAHMVDGWRTLLDSQAVVLFPQNATEGGRLAVIALARGLGAGEGDFTPALDALASLNSQNRLNPQDEYNYDGYKYVYQPGRLKLYDAVVLWDYQARTLTRMSDDWDIIVPVEGALTVDCGYVYAGPPETLEKQRRLMEYLSSETGAQALTAAGFSPLQGEPDLSAWDLSRLTYNPAFRRDVLAVKLFAPASVLERLLLQSAVLLLFAALSQRVLRRIPRGLRRTTSFYGLLFAALWLLLGIAKTLSVDNDPARYLWFAGYIPRHILPLCWVLMCYVNRYDRLPARKCLTGLAVIAALLSAAVLTNDLHRQIFVYTYADSDTWGRYYGYGWGYYLSLLWSLSLCAAGLGHILRNKMTRRQRRQMTYAGVFFAALISYQLMYVAGVKNLIDLDIPTTVALFILAFNLAAQRERFMGASLMDLPIFQHTPYAIAVYDGAGRAVYRNTAMTELIDEDTGFPGFALESDELREVMFAERTYKSRGCTLDTGRALVLEDITGLKRLEASLRHTHMRLKAVGGLLANQADEAGTLAGSLERQRHLDRMDRLFHEKLADVRQSLDTDSGAGERDEMICLRRIRFRICICQRRLRFILRGMDAQAPFPMALIESYAAGVLQDGARLGLDGVVTASSGGVVPSGIAAALLEAVDAICLDALDYPGASLVCRLEADRGEIFLGAVLSWESFEPAGGTVLQDRLSETVARLGGELRRDAEDDSVITRLRFRCEEASG